MKKKLAIITRMHLVESLLIIGIIAVPASLVLRVLYAHQMIEWENNLVESVGIPAELYRITLGIGFFCVLIALAVRERRKRKKQKQAGYQLPKS